MNAVEEGAHSVYRFIDRTAERVPDGVRWQTIDYSNHPHHHYAAFDGCGGIGAYLAEYGGRRGRPQPSTWPARPTAGARRSTWRASSAVSNGLDLLRLWETTQESRYLEGARRNGVWLCEQLVRDDDGCHCLCRPDGQFGDPPPQAPEQRHQHDHCLLEGQSEACRPQCRARLPTGEQERHQAQRKGNARISPGLLVDKGCVGHVEKKGGHGDGFRCRHLPMAGRGIQHHRRRDVAADQCPAYIPEGINRGWRTAATGVDRGSCRVCHWDTGRCRRRHWRR